MSLKHKQYYAVIAGVCASVASFFGKLTSFANSDSDIWKETNIMIVRILCILLMIICNAMVWTFFIKALHNKGGSLVATIISAASNYSCSAILGCFIFGEVVSVFWAFGTLLVICGLILLLFNEAEEVTKCKIK